MGEVRLQHLVRFYALLDRLERNIGGARCLSGCSGRTDWPQRGVYFFREPGESRSTLARPRIVRVGTHALKAGSGTRLWTRLSQHKGQPGTGGGNHRGSIFRLLVGTALINRHGHSFPTWDVGNTAKADVRAAELALEREVSAVIGAMPFLWIAITDDAGPGACAATSSAIRLHFSATTGRTRSTRPRKAGSARSATASWCAVRPLEPEARR